MRLNTCFAGVRLGGPSFEPALIEYDQGSLAVGVWSNFPIKSKVIGQSDPEFDFYGSYSFDVAKDDDPGARLSPSTPTRMPKRTTDSTRPPSNPTCSPQLHHRRPGNSTPKILHYDFVLKGPTLELSAAYTVPLPDLKTELDFTGTIGTFKWTDAFENTTPKAMNVGDYYADQRRLSLSRFPPAPSSPSASLTAKGSNNFFKQGTDHRFENTGGRGSLRIQPQLRHLLLILGGPFDAAASFSPARAFWRGLFFVWFRANDPRRNRLACLETAGMRPLSLALLVLGAGAALSIPLRATTYVVTADFPVASKYVFRGLPVARASFQPSLRPATAGANYASLWLNQPFFLPPRPGTRRQRRAQFPTGPGLEPRCRCHSLLLSAGRCRGWDAGSYCRRLSWAERSDLEWKPTSAPHLFRDFDLHATTWPQGTVGYSLPLNASATLKPVRRGRLRRPPTTRYPATPIAAWAQRCPASSATPPLLLLARIGPTHIDLAAGGEGQPRFTAGLTVVF